MTKSPFEDQEGVYYVLSNDDSHYSLWPASAAIPAGWRVVHDRSSRDICLAYVAEHSQNARPNQGARG